MRMNAANIRFLCRQRADSWPNQPEIAARLYEGRDGGDTAWSAIGNRASGMNCQPALSAAMAENQVRLFRSAVFRHYAAAIVSGRCKGEQAAR